MVQVPPYLGSSAWSAVVPADAAVAHRIALKKAVPMALRSRLFKCLSFRLSQLLASTPVGLACQCQ